MFGLSPEGAARFSGLLLEDLGRQEQFKIRKKELSQQEKMFTATTEFKYKQLQQAADQASAQLAQEELLQTMSDVANMARVEERQRGATRRARIGERGAFERAELGLEREQIGEAGALERTQLGQAGAMERAELGAETQLEIAKLRLQPTIGQTRSAIDVKTGQKVSEVLTETGWTQAKPSQTNIYSRDKSGAVSLVASLPKGSRILEQKSDNPAMTDIATVGPGGEIEVIGSVPKGTRLVFKTETKEALTYEEIG